MSHFYSTSEELHPFQIKQITNPTVQDKGNIMGPLALYIGDTLIRPFTVMAPTTMALAHPRLSLKNFAWLLTRSKEGLDTYVKLLLKGVIPCFSYELSEAESPETKTVIETQHIPRLLKSGFLVYAYEEGGCLTLIATSQKHLNQFYPADFVITLLEWRADLWKEAFNEQPILDWEELFKDWTVAEFISYLYEQPTKFTTSAGLGLRPEDLSWFLTESQAVELFLDSFFTHKADRQLIELCFKGYPPEAAMGKVAEQYPEMFKF